MFFVLYVYAKVCAKVWLKMKTSNNHNDRNVAAHRTYFRLRPSYKDAFIIPPPLLRSSLVIGMAGLKSVGEGGSVPALLWDSETRR